MNLEVKEKWVSALLSGDYKQGEGYLRDEDKFCCLGVLCDLAVKDGVIDPPFKATSGIYLYDGENSAFLPEKVSQWAGLDSDNPIPNVPRVEDQNSLSGYNDDGIPFNEIAQIIKDYM
jgi:hypothetical protein